MKSSLAVLLTCHNRKNKTLKCLKKLFRIHIPNEIDKLDVFLVDDGSNDGTGNSVKKIFPTVNVIQGNGNLFWNKGMRLAWDSAVKSGEYDFYIWLNDDVILEDYALLELFECYYDAISQNNHVSIITGAFKNSIFEEDFSYGGRNEKGDVIPNGSMQQCKFINGNTVLVPKSIFNTLGNLSADYTHGMGDYDYGLRAIKSGFYNYTTKKYIGVCPVNPEPKWSDAQTPLKKRLELFNSPRGLNFKEYIIFRKKFWKNKWIIFAIKAYLKVLFPALYKKMVKQ